MTELPEVVLGRGDYAAGGARSQPFLDLDGARRRRPLVFGEVLGDPSQCDPLTAQMFSGRASDPCEWAVMWKEVGADGVCVRTRGMSPEDSADVVRRISDRTRLPVAVDCDADSLDAVASAVTDSVMILLGADSAPGSHVCAPETAGGRMALVRGRFPDPEPYASMRGMRSRGLEGDGSSSMPIVFDATPVWEDAFADARAASMVEAESALAAMLSGADVIIVRGPGAADMARVYGEELADL